MLKVEPLIRGLELSFNGGLHPAGIAHLGSLLQPGWENVVTNIPGTIAAVARDPRYGLASASDEGRDAAIADVQEIHRELATLREILGENAVVAVELHSAPVAGPRASSAERLADSLTQIAAWDWGSTRLVVEHADALVDGHPPQKGWLSLEAELAATELASARTGRRIGHTVNWGRSAIETQSADGPEQHLRQLVAAGALAGVMFSGASGLATGRSTPWQDVHLAVDTVEPESLLTGAEIERTLATIAGADPLYMGVKVGRAVDSSTLEKRLAPGLATLSALNGIRGHR